MERGDNCTRDLMSSVKIRRDSVRDLDAGESEAEELDRLAQETREKGVSWKSLKAELGL
jgi:hypothetical protein